MGSASDVVTALTIAFQLTKQYNGSLRIVGVRLVLTLYLTREQPLSADLEWLRQRQGCPFVT
jgi:hypothetical protein